MFSGGISAGASGVSFWGGSGADTFNFTGGISNASGTAYFWNAEAGVDSINLSNAGTVQTGLHFGVTTGAGLVVNFGSVSDAFSASGAASALFSLSEATNEATVAYSGTTGVFLTFRGGTDITFLGAAGLASEISTTFGDKLGTISFGSVNWADATYS